MDGSRVEVELEVAVDCVEVAVGAGDASVIDVARARWRVCMFEAKKKFLFEGTRSILGCSLASDFERAILSKSGKTFLLIW